MSGESFHHITSISTWDSGGGINLDLIELDDGQILAISEDAVVLYNDIDDLESGDPSKSRPWMPRYPSSRG